MGRRKFRPSPPFLSLLDPRGVATDRQHDGMLESAAAVLFPSPPRPRLQRPTDIFWRKHSRHGPGTGERPRGVGAGEGGATDSARGAARGRATGCSLEARVRSGEMGAWAGRVKRGGEAAGPVRIAGWAEAGYATFWAHWAGEGA